MKKIGILIAALAGLLVGAQAQAQTNSTYLGVSGAAVWTDAARSLATLTGGVHDDKIPNGFKVFGGRVWDRFGVEFGYYNLGEYDIIDATNAVQDQLETTAFAVSWVYATPIAQGYHFNFKLGLAFTEATYDCKLLCGAPFLDTKRRGTSGLIGVGVAWQASGNFALRMDFEHLGSVQHAVSQTKFKEGYDMFSVGAQLNF
jgi:hypothetical protein